MATSLGPTTPLQILVPQLICFALNNSSIALNATKPDFDKIDRDMKKRNKLLGDKVKNLQNRLAESTEDNLKLQSQVYSLHGNLTRVTQQLQESKLMQLHFAGYTTAGIVEQMASLYEERDLYKTKLIDTEEELEEIKSKCSILERKLNDTEKLLNETNYKFFYTNQIVNVLIPDRPLFLTEAVSLGNTSLVIPLLRLGTAVTAKDIYGFSPLGWTAVEGDPDIARELVQAGSDVKTILVQNNDTSLHIAARNGFSEVVQILLESGADPNASNMHQNTPLHEAAYFGHEEVARLLLDAGAQVDPRNNNNVTPLQFAAEKGYLPVVQILVNRGADRGVRNKVGRTPQEEAQHRGKQGVSWWLGQQV